MYPPHSYSASYPPEGYGYGYGAEDEFVGAPPPPPPQPVARPFPTVAVVGIVAATALGVYLLYTANKHIAPMQKRVTDAAFKALTTEAKRQGRLVSKGAGEALTNIARGYVDSRLATRPPPKHVKVEVIRTIPT